MNLLKTLIFKRYSHVQQGQGAKRLISCQLGPSVMENYPLTSKWDPCDLLENADSWVLPQSGRIRIYILISWLVYT